MFHIHEPQKTKAVELHDEVFQSRMLDAKIAWINKFSLHNEFV